MKKYLEILRKCPLFTSIEDNNLIAMLGCLGAKVISYKKKETIIAEGAPAKYIGIVLSGSVQIMRIDYFGNRSIVTHAETSQLFGEAFACAELAEMPVDIIAAKDCEIMLIDCSRIIYSCSNACAFHSQMIFNLLKVVAAKNIILNQKTEITSLRTTEEKLMAYLQQQAKKNKNISFTIPYDRQELADYLGVDRSGLSAVISRLRNNGTIECKRNYFRLL